MRKEMNLQTWKDLLESPADARHIDERVLRLCAVTLSLAKN